MLYILVRNTMNWENQERPFQGTRTYIDCQNYQDLPGDHRSYDNSYRTLSCQDYQASPAVHLSYNGPHRTLSRPLKSLSTTRVDADDPRTDDYGRFPLFHGQRPVPCTYWTNKPPYVVLEELGREGYKVVATHTVNNTCMWTLHG